MIFKNIKNGQIANITNPNLIVEYLSHTDLTKAPKELVGDIDDVNKYQNSIEWEIGTNADISTEVEPSPQEQAEYQQYLDDKARLHKISEHLIQDSLGIKVPNIEQEKQDFLIILNRCRAYEKKEPKVMKI